METNSKITLTGSSQNEGPVTCYITNSEVLLHYTTSTDRCIDPMYVNVHPEYFHNVEEMELELKNARIIRNKFKNPNNIKCKVDNKGFISIEDDTEKDIVRIEFFKKHLMNWKKYIINLDELQSNILLLDRWVDKLKSEVGELSELKPNLEYSFGFNIGNRSPMLHVNFSIGNYRSTIDPYRLTGEISHSDSEERTSIKLGANTIIKLHIAFVSFVSNYLKQTILNQL